ncbi:MAG TPA: ferredoxin--NADP reductase [Candidatus Acidoferrales bacterium]|nr:ferredoxin--NADP reductase [Candidatus Acidoferrales bacterium]
MSSPLEKFYSARVTYRRDVAPDLWILRIDPGAEFKFIPGQYATLGAETPSGFVERPYSIVSSPYERELEFFIEFVPDGELTAPLHTAQPGTALSLRRMAKGRFTLDRTSGHRNHLLLCTVTGVAPYMSYVRTLYADWKGNQFPDGIRIYLIQGASRSWEFGYREELEGIAANVPWLTYVPTVSRFAEDPSWEGEKGRVDDIIRKHADAWRLSPAGTTAYLCGHPSMVENGTRILERAGFPRKSLKQEAYWAE